MWAGSGGDFSERIKEYRRLREMWGPDRLGQEDGYWGVVEGVEIERGRGVG
jgi:hypothetical protein